jgi:hypothetical protein
MDFDGYFTATEHAFVQEKGEMLDRLDEIRHSWDEVVNLDGLAAKQCDDLQQLKGLLSKGHLQILRTREETVRVELQNSLTAFRVRQLQREIWRFLPHTRTPVPSIDYQLAIARTPGTTVEGPPTEPDEKVVKELGEFHRTWQQLLIMQASVAEEEKAHRQADNDYFEKFSADFRSQNSEAHRAIDHQLDQLIRRIMRERHTADDTAFQHRSMIEAMTRRQKLLGEKADAIDRTAGDKAMAARLKAQKQVGAETSAVRERIRSLERHNMMQYADLTERNTVVHQRHKELLSSVMKLRKQEKELLQKNYSLLDRGRGRVNEVRDKMNALVSSVTALETSPASETDKLLAQVAAAMGCHGAAVRSAHLMDRRVQNLGDRVRRTRR